MKRLQVSVGVRDCRKAFASLFASGAHSRGDVRFFIEAAALITLLSCARCAPGRCAPPHCLESQGWRRCLDFNNWLLGLVA